MPGHPVRTGIKRPGSGARLLHKRIVVVGVDQRLMADGGEPTLRIGTKPYSLMMPGARPTKREHLLACETDLHGFAEHPRCDCGPHKIGVNSQL